MKKIIILPMVLTSLMISTNLQADVTAGKKQYLKNCKVCHGKGGKGAHMGTLREWDKYFKNSATTLLQKHKTNNKANRYFNSKKFKKHAVELKKFLQEFALDSGNTPSC